MPPDSADAVELAPEDFTLDDPLPARLDYRTAVPKKPSRDRTGWFWVVIQVVSVGTLTYFVSDATGLNRLLLWTMIVAGTAFALLGTFVALTSGGGPNTVARRSLAASRKG